jgi:hypothetical protein
VEAVEDDDVSGEIAGAEEPVSSDERSGVRQAVARPVEIYGPGLAVIAGKNDGSVAFMRLLPERFSTHGQL